MKTSTEGLPKEKKFRLLMLLGIGIAVSLYLVYHHVQVVTGQQLAPSICSFSATFDCDKVARSAFSEVLGVPVASFGLLFYLLVFGIIWWTPSKTAKLPSVLWFWSILGLIPTLFLALVSLVVIQSICLFCTILYVLNIALLFICAHLPGVRGDLFGAFTDGLQATVLYLISAVSNRRVAMNVFAAGITAAVVLTVHVPLSSPVDPETQGSELEFAYGIWKQSRLFKFPEESLDQDFTIGSADAPVTVVGFSDFECPFCQRFAPVFHKLVHRYRGKVRFHFKHFPLSSLCNEHIQGEKHRYACKSGLYARCAGLQSPELFWQVHDGIMGLGSKIDDQSLDELIKSVPIDRSSFQACIDEPKSMQKIKADIELGRKNLVNGTPSVFINGRRLVQLNPEVLFYIVGRLVSEQ